MISGQSVSVPSLAGLSLEGARAVIEAEGLVLGVAAKMFVIAGPVIVYGIVASVLYGLIYWLTTLF